MAGMINTYRTEWPAYGLSWSLRPDKPFRLAVGSYIEELANRVRGHFKMA